MIVSNHLGGLMLTHINSCKHRWVLFTICGFVVVFAPNYLRKNVRNVKFHFRN